MGPLAPKYLADRLFDPWDTIISTTFTAKRGEISVPDQAQDDVDGARHPVTEYTWPTTRNVARMVHGIPFNQMGRTLLNHDGNFDISSVTARCPAWDCAGLRLQKTANQPRLV
jgi:hypothetical protein